MTSNQDSKQTKKILAIDSKFTDEFDREFEQLALFIAQDWRDEHRDGYPYSQTDFDDCTQYVRAEMIKVSPDKEDLEQFRRLANRSSALVHRACWRILIHPDN